MVAVNYLARVANRGSGYFRSIFSLPLNLLISVCESDMQSPGAFFNVVACMSYGGADFAEFPAVSEGW